MPSLVRLLLALFLSVVAATSLRAAPRFTGPVRYDFANNETQVTLSASLIQNNSKENATGTLKLELWATTSPYESGTIRGALCGLAKLEGLGPGQHWKDVHRTVPYKAPSVRGSYFMTMALLEYKGGEYVIVHHVNMTNKASLGPLPLFTMEGPWRFHWSEEGGTVDIEVAKISHRRTGNTGSLKLAVWLTDTPYHGGKLSGYEIGQVRKDPLKAGFVYSNVKNTAKFVRPPAGDYCASLVLFESDGKEFLVVSWLNSTTISHVSAPAQ